MITRGLGRAAGVLAPAASARPQLSAPHAGRGPWRVDRSARALLARGAAALACACLAVAPVRALGPELSGRILLQGGKPAPATTTIELRRIEPDVERAARLASGTTDPPAPVATAHPDATGRFALTAPVGNWVVSVRAPGCVAAATQVAGLVDDAELDDIVLSPEARLPVEVRGASGAPLADAWVSARNDDPSPLSRSARPSPWRHLERSDAKGTAVVSCVENERLKITVVGAGTAAETSTRCGKTPLRVTLPADAPRPVAIRGSQNEPLAGAVLIDTESYLPLVRTSRDGTATLPVPARGLDVFVLAPGHAKLPTTLPPAAPNGAPVALRLEPLARLSGRVLESGTRRVLEGALVWAWADPGGFVKSDARGEFTLDGDPTRVQVAASGHADTYVSEAGSLAQATVLLEPVAVIKGRVVDAARKPVEGARLVARPDLARPSRRERREVTAQSRADGTFRLAELAPEGAYEVVARREGYAPSRVALTPAAVGALQPELEIVLGAGSSVTLRVLDAEGRALAGTHGELQPREAEGDPRQRRFFDPRNRPTGIATESGADGVLRWAHVDSGLFDVTVRARGFAPLKLPGIRIPTPSEHAPAQVDLGSARLAPGVALQGIAVDPAGAPLGGIAVWAQPRGEMFFGAGFREPDATTGLDGTFSIGDLGAGELLNVMARGERRTDAQVSGVEVPNDTPLRLVLPPLSRVRGRVVDLEGRPVRGAEIDQQNTMRSFGAIFSRSPRRSTVSAEDGTFVLDDVPAGPMQVVASREGYLTAQSGNLEVPAGRDLEGVELVLRPGASVSGRVVDAEGAPIADASVMLQGDRGRWSNVAPVETDGDGRYRLSEVPPGLQTLIAESEDQGRAAQEIEVKLGENTADFRLGGGFDLSGTVVDERDQPVAGARIALVGRDLYSMNRGREAVAGADGTFTLHGAQKGRTELEAHATGYADGRLGPLEIDGPRGGLTLRLTRGGGKISGALRGVDLRELGSAEVRALPADGGVWRFGVVDAGGRYRVTGLTSGEWTVEATVDQGRRRARGKARVEDGTADTTLDLDFAVGLTLSGRVTRNQMPVSAVSVFAFGVESGNSANGQTDADGRFRLEGLAAGKYNLAVHSPRGQLHHELLELTEDRELAIAVNTGVVRGRVTDAADGAPLAGARVELLPVEIEAGEMFFGGSSVTSDSSGGYRLEDAPAGAYKVVASHDGYATGEARAELVEGGEAGADVALERSDGVALDLSRAGAQSVDVVALGANGGVVFGANLVSTDSGRVRLSTLPLGTYRILVATAGNAVATVTATVPGPAVPVALVPGGLVEVTIPELADETRGGVVSMLDAAQAELQVPRWGNLVSAWPVNGGKAEIDGVPPGTWTVRAVSPATGKTWTATVSVGAGTVRVELK